MVRGFFLVVLTLALTACGFQLRGSAALPFQTLYLDAGKSQQLGSELASALRFGSNARLVSRPEEAEAVLQLVDETREKRILSLSAGGRVREFQLFYRVSFRVQDAKGGELLPAQQIELKRDFSYSDAQVLAKEQEEALLYRDMQNDAVQQILRRLAAAKPRPAP